MNFQTLRENAIVKCYKSVTFRYHWENYTEYQAPGTDIS